MNDRTQDGPPHLQDQFAAPVNDTGASTVQRESPRQWIKIFNRTLSFLIVVDIISCIGASAYFFNIGGDAIFLILVVAIYGSISLAVLMVIRTVLAGVVLLKYLREKEDRKKGTGTVNS